MIVNVSGISSLKPLFMEGSIFLWGDGYDFYQSLGIHGIWSHGSSLWVSSPQQLEIPPTYPTGPTGVNWSANWDEPWNVLPSHGPFLWKFCYGKPPGFLKVNHPIDGAFPVVMVVYWRVILCNTSTPWIVHWIDTKLNQRFVWDLMLGEGIITAHSARGFFHFLSWDHHCCLFTLFIPKRSHVFICKKDMFSYMILPVLTYDLH